MKEKINALIDKLADKTLSFGCRLYCHKDLKIRIITNDKTKGQWWLELESPSYKERFPKYLIQTEEGTLGLGDGEYADYTGRIKILGHDIMIGDVLKRMTGLMIDKPELGQQLLGYWCDCGFKNSFQQIVSDSGWAEIPAKKDCREGETNYHVEVLKDKNANALAEFLLDIFNQK